METNLRTGRKVKRQRGKKREALKMICENWPEVDVPYLRAQGETALGKIRKYALKMSYSTAVMQVSYAMIRRITRPGTRLNRMKPVISDLSKAAEDVAFHPSIENQLLRKINL